MKNRTQVLLTMTTAALLAAGLAQAEVYDFSDGSYTDGPLTGQNGWLADSNNVISSGELVMATTNDWATAMRADGVSETNNRYTVSSWFSFDQTGPKGAKQEVHRIMLNDATGGGTPISAILRRGAGNYILQTKTDQPGSAANQGWQPFTADLIGLVADTAGHSDDLYMSITFSRGETADTWSSDVVLSNLTASTVVRSEVRAGIFDVTTNMHNAATLWGGVSGSQDDAGVGVTNRVVTKIEVAAEYISSDSIFSYDMTHLADSEPFSNTAGWDSLGQWGWGFVNTNASAGSRLVHRPKSTDPEFATNKKGWDWRGVIYTNGLPRAVEVNETLEFSVDYTMFAHTNISNRTATDFFFSTNGVSTAGASGTHTPSQQSFGTYPDGQLGFRVKQGSWTNNSTYKDGGFNIHMDPADVNASAGGVGLNEIGITNLSTGASDSQSDPATLTFSAFKTETAGVWDLTISIQNQNGDTLKLIEKPSWTNDALYNATTDIYFGMYGYHTSIAEEGVELDNMACRIIYADPSTLSLWEQFQLAQGVGEKGEDDDTDGEDNWYEYVLGGDPKEITVQASQPWFDGAGQYMITVRGDDSLSYSIISTENLVHGTWVTNGPTPIALNDGEIHEIPVDVGTTNNPLFMKLIVE